MKLRNVSFIYILCLICAGTALLRPTHAGIPFKWWDRDYGAAKSDMLTVMVATADGFLLGGSSNSDVSPSKSQLCKGNYDYWIIKINTNGIKQWDKTYGGNGWDYLEAILPTQDGGFLLGGGSLSPQSGDKTGPNKGNFDYWIVKVDANGIKQWDKTVGGSGYDYLTALAYDKEDYVLGGFSNSSKSGDKSEPAFADYEGLASTDYWLVRLNANGNITWDKTVGSDGNDYLEQLFVDPVTHQYTLIGSSNSLKNVYKSENLKGVDGENDYWIIALSASGQKLWDNTIGGPREDYLFTALQTDRGYLLGGISASGLGDDNTSGHFGSIGSSYDYWLVNVDADGTKIWDQTFGGVDNEFARALIKTNDGGYIVGGWSESGVTGNKTVPSKGGDDYWIVKMDKNGVKNWDTAFGGSKDDQMEAMLPFTVPKGEGYLLGGASNSPLGVDKSQDVWGNNTLHDYWIVRALEN